MSTEKHYVIERLYVLLPANYKLVIAQQSGEMIGAVRHMLAEDEAETYIFQLGTKQVKISESKK